MQGERLKNNDILFHFRKDGLPMTKLSQLKIDPEFQNQINPPSFEETHQLEMNILKEERVLNPIITWNGYIVDGHTRYQILRKYPFIPFEVIEKEFSSRYEALVWICKNQLGRRNLTPEQKKFLIGKQAEVKKIVQHSNNIFATCNSALLPLHEKADLLSILQGYNTVAPVGGQFFIVCNDHNGLALCFELLQ